MRIVWPQTPPARGGIAKGTTMNKKILVPAGRRDGHAGGRLGSGPRDLGGVITGLTGAGSLDTLRPLSATAGEAIAREIVATATNWTLPRQDRRHPVVRYLRHRHPRPPARHCVPAGGGHGDVGWCPGR